MNYPAGVDINHPHFDEAPVQEETGVYVYIEDEMQDQCKFADISDALDGAKAMLGQYYAENEMVGVMLRATFQLELDNGEDYEKLDVELLFDPKTYTFQKSLFKKTLSSLVGKTKDDVAQAHLDHNEAQAEAGNVEKMK